MDAQSQRQQVWSRYWAGGAAHSCANSYGDRYGGAIAAFWRQIHDATPAGARLLDLATGSGAIPRLWRDWRTSDEWHAVDLALQAPPWMAAAGPGLQFHPAVQAEALPFPAAHFDLVTSQYGLEYCSLPRAVPEVLRVRAPRGAVALVLHHAQSRPVALARAEVAHLDWALGPQGLVPACADMLRPVAEAQSPQGRARLSQDPVAEQARLRFNAAQVALRARADTADGADVLADIQDTVGGLLQMAMQRGDAAARARLVAWQETLADHRWRLAELCSHALDESAARALCGPFDEAGLQVTLGTLDDGPHRMGWTLQAVPR